MTDPLAEGPPAPKRSRWPWTLLGIGVALAVLVRAVLPFAVARGLEVGARRASGLPVRVENVDLGLLRGTLEVAGVTVGRAAAAEPALPLLGVRRLAAELSWRDLLRGRLRLRELALEGPALRLVRLADGSLEDPFPPAIPEPQGPAEDGEPGGWPVEVDRVRVAGAVFQLADPGSELPALDFALEELVLRDLGLAGEDVTLGGVELRGPQLRVTRALLAPRAAPAAAPAPQPVPEPAPPTATAAAQRPRYRLEQLAVERAEISLLTEGQPLELGFDLSATGVGASPGETFPLTVTLRVGDGEVRAEGSAGLAPPSFEGTLRWRDLPIPLFVLAARPDLVPWVRSCRSEGELTLDARLGAEGGSEAPPAARASGRFAVRDLALGDPERKEVELGWRALEVELREALLPLAGDGAPIRVELASVKIVAPEVRYARPTPALDALLGVAPPAGADAAGPAGSTEEAAAPPADAAPALLLTVDSLELAGGSLGFADGTLETPFRTALSELALSAREVRWPELHLRALRARGIAPERAPFTLSGSFDGGRGELAFEVQRLALPALDPYATSAGYKLTRGEASVRASLRIEPERYVAENDLLLHDLRLDALDDGAFERQFGASLDLTLALLRRPSGDIRLPLPLTLERESLRFGRGEVVRGALRAALLGVLSSPLKALGAALPRGGESEIDAAALAAVAGGPELAPAETARVKALGKLLRTRPLLALTLRGQSGPEDRPALAEALLRERAAAGEALPAVEGAGFFAARRVAEALRSDATGALAPEDGALLARMIAATEPPPERFASLARARADGLRERLVGGKRPVDAGRITVAESGEEGAPGVALELVARTEEVLP